MKYIRETLMILVALIMTSMIGGCSSKESELKQLMMQIGASEKQADQEVQAFRGLPSDRQDEMLNLFRRLASQAPGGKATSL